MTKQLLLMGGFILAVGGPLGAADGREHPPVTPSDNLPPAAGFAWRQETNKAFAVGEKIVYDVRYGVVPSGRAVQEVIKLEDVGGRRAYHILSDAKSNKTVDVFHKIRERHETWMDAESLCALKFVDTVREGRYRRHSVTVFDPPAGRFTHAYKSSKSEGRETHDMPPFVQDMLSVVYFLRTRDLKPGDELVVPTFSSGEVWNVKVRAQGIEKVDVGAGKFECVHLVPVLEKDKKDRPKGQLEVWLTTDERKIPVKLSTDLGVGSFEARMREYVPGKGQ